MIVLKVDVDGVLAIKGKREPKVARHLDGPASFPIALKRMQSPAGNTHVLRMDGGIQSVQHSIDSRTVCAWNSARSAFGRSPRKAFMAESADHVRVRSSDSNALLYIVSSNALQHASSASTGYANDNCLCIRPGCASAFRPISELGPFLAALLWH